MYKRQAETGRFAPSPSGQLHMGNLAACLLAWLDARSTGGRLIFRMEDLDPERSKGEYIEALRSFPFDGKHLNITDDEGQHWEIYFVPATGETTEVPVPKNLTYEVSGNNVDGFIITIKK